jgi:hypothetical protein
MAQTQISDVVVPEVFTQYQVENSMLSTVLFQSVVLPPKTLMGVPYSNVANNSADMVNDIRAASGAVTLPGTTVTVPANTRPEDLKLSYFTKVKGAVACTDC